MKKSLYILLAGAALFGAGNLMAWEAKKDTPILKMIQDTEKVIRSNDVKKAVEALEALKKQKDLSGADRTELQMRLADLMFRQKPAMSKEANAIRDEILAAPDAPVGYKMRIYNERAKAAFNSNFPHGGIVYYNTGIEKALALYLEAEKKFGASLSVGAKIELARNIANCYLELDQVEKANEVLIAATKLPDLQGGNYYAAYLNLAQAYRRQHRADLALPIYLDVMEKVPGMNVHQRRHCMEFVFPMLRKQLGDTAALAFAKRYHGDQFEEYQIQCGIFEPAIKNAETALENAKGEGKFTPFMRLLTLAEKKKDGSYTKVWNKYFAIVMKEAPNSMKRHYLSVAQGHRHWLNNQRNKNVATAILNNLRAYVLKVHPDNLFVRELEMDCLFYSQNWAELEVCMKNLLKRTDLGENNRIRCTLILETMTNKSGKAIARKVEELLKASKNEKLHTLKVLADNLRIYARLALQMGKEEVAKEIWAVREGMLVPESKRSLKVRFIKNGPRDISEFLASDLIKDPKNLGVLDRKYGDNLQFLLETDAAITGRVITEDKAGAKPTTFVATCDETGVYLFFMMPCDEKRAEQIRLGNAGFGGFEFYLTTGYDQPYNCLLIDGPPSCYAGDDFVTMYDNRFYRRLYSGNKNITCDFRVDKDQVLMLIKVDWLGVMNGIPTNGFKWELEPLHWERGGWSWGGSKSVHNRSSFGDLIFDNMTKENVTLIKRRLLAYAKKAYNAEFNSRVRGALEHWGDPELGDLGFHNEVIVPFIKKYGAYVAAIKPDMSDDEVNRVYDEAYETLINTTFVVEALRRDYIERKLMEDED